jgi:predicted secreted protein
MTKTLTKEFGAVTGDFAGAVFTLDSSNSIGNWRQLAAGSGVCIADTYFDLAGIAIDDKTLFFEGAAIQEVIPPTTTLATAGDIVNVVDLMTTKPLTDNQVFLYSLNANIIAPNSTLTFDQTVYGRVRVFNIDLDNQAGGYYIKLGDNQTGSLEATASDRIYCYRMVAFVSQANATVSMNGARYLLRASAKEEAEYQYLMRLKRSYELQNEPDRD